MAEQEEVILTVKASAPRRAFGVGLLLFLGLLLIYLAFSGEAQGFDIKFFLVIMGGGALYLAERMRQATNEVIELTGTQLRTSRGEVLAELDQVLRVDRGTFAFKPSNGFIMVLRAAGKRRWQPGMWWRIGRRVGVGGITSAAQAKAMAEVIQAQIVAAEGGR